ncbi:hypothetical protein CPBF424_38600 [Xanthomonas euroxanthea]|uniref:Uncharacterized protein n=1 Tax=Xanthomonas euroxanthea TaxID=2259622 RepID=A0AA46CBG1_9XANT|nr:hypothetical protein CPBF424_38600 [Xanthomonas euroxanthea]
MGMAGVRVAPIRPSGTFPRKREKAVAAPLHDWTSGLRRPYAA